jgi:Raf kinase inhibitor-like YbhB/YbcL family protein
MDLQRPVSPSPYDYLPAVPSFAVTSSDLTHGAVVDMRCVHDSAGGGNASPQLSWSGFPPETQSFAVTCFDPDAPTLSGWWHWLVADLPATTTELAHGAGAPDGSGLPASAVQFRTDYGSYGYQGSAPPPGDFPHRYYFVVHALDVPSLGLAADTPAAVVGFHLTAHALARATLVATYQH